MTLVLLEPAERELDEAIAFYNTQVDGLGDTFLIEFLRAADLIERHPQAWQKLGLNTRRCRLSRFPYGLVYACETDQIVIVAVAHLHRRPDYWRERVADQDMP